MSKIQNKIIQKGALFNAQYEMCDVVYRKLFELMLSINEVKIETKFAKKIFIIELYKSDFRLAFSTRTEYGGRSLLGFIQLKKISLTEIEDPVLQHICAQSEFANLIPDKYTEWLEIIKNIMQDLLNKEQKYKNIIGNIRAIPLFSPTREVLIEKL